MNNSGIVINSAQVVYSEPITERTSMDGCWYHILGFLPYYYPITSRVCRFWYDMVAASPKKPGLFIRKLLEENHNDLIIWLLQDNPPADKNSLLQVIAETNNIILLRELAWYQELDWDSALWKASKHGCLTTLSFARRRGANKIDKAMVIASANGQVAAMTLLKQWQESTDWSRILQAALMHGQADSLRLLRSWNVVMEHRLVYKYLFWGNSLACAKLLIEWDIYPQAHHLSTFIVRGDMELFWYCYPYYASSPNREVSQLDTYFHFLVNGTFDKFLRQLLADTNLLEPRITTNLDEFLLVACVLSEKSPSPELRQYSDEQDHQLCQDPCPRGQDLVQTLILRYGLEVFNNYSAYLIGYTGNITILYQLYDLAPQYGVLHQYCFIGAVMGGQVGTMRSIRKQFGSESLYFNITDTLIPHPRALQLLVDWNISLRDRSLCELMYMVEGGILYPESDYCMQYIKKKTLSTISDNCLKAGNILSMPIIKALFCDDKLKIDLMDKILRIGNSEWN